MQAHFRRLLKDVFWSPAIWPLLNLRGALSRRVSSSDLYSQPSTAAPRSSSQITHERGAFLQRSRVTLTYILNETRPTCIRTANIATDLPPELKETRLASKYQPCRLQY